MKERIPATLTAFGETTKVSIIKGEYANGGTCLQAVGHYEDGDEPYATLTAWVEGLEEGEIGFKDWFENQGMLNQAIQQGIVTEPHRAIPSGFVVVKVCRLGKAWE